MKFLYQVGNGLYRATGAKSGEERRDGDEEFGYLIQGSKFKVRG
jgi:hypothetical protein